MIRQAELADFGAITNIIESSVLSISRLADAEYRVGTQRSGFLLPIDLSLERYQEEFYQTCSVAELEGQTVGYMRLQDDQDIPSGTEAFWLRPDLQDTYYSKPHAAIYGTGVLPDANRRGVATEMLQAAERQVRAKNIPWLFSEIVTSPVTNLASLAFHEKNGFKRIALTNPARYLGMEGFQSLLYGKQLS